MGQDLGGPLGQQLQVSLGGQRGLLEVGGRLGDRQRQVIYRIRDATGISDGQAVTVEP